jgi:hypothetical protein
VAGDEIALGEVWVARQDERIDPGFTQFAKFAGHLIRVSHDGDSGTAARTANPRPEMSLHVAVVVGCVTQFALACHSCRRGVEGLRPDRGAGFDVQT